MIEAYNALILISFYVILILFFCRMTKHFFDKRIMSRAIIFFVGACGILYKANKAIREIFWPALDLEPIIKVIGIMIATLPGILLMPKFNNWLKAAEKKLIELEIFAKDSNGWSEEWREKEVRERLDDILSKSDAIQEDWIQNRHKKFTYFMLIAIMFWYYDMSVVRGWLIADRDENYKQLELAKKIAEEKNIK